MPNALRIGEAIWRAILRFAPTSNLQYALKGRPGVRVEWVKSGERRTYEVQGVCWVTINED